MSFLFWRAHKRTRGYWGQKTLAWLKRSQLEDKWRWRWWMVVGFFAVIFIIFSSFPFTYSPSYTRVYFFPFLPAQTHLQSREKTRSIKKFFFDAYIRYYVLIHLHFYLLFLEKIKVFLRLQQLSELSWRETFSSKNEGWNMHNVKYCIF